MLCLCLCLCLCLLLGEDAGEVLDCFVGEEAVEVDVKFPALRRGSGRGVVVVEVASGFPVAGSHEVVFGLAA